MLRALPIVAASAALVASAAGRPEVFTDMSYAEAKAAAAEQNRYFLVKATAVWCPPCKAMDRDTWPDEGVRAWVAEHAIAYSLDVDAEPKIAAELRIRAMPTMVVFDRSGTEFDRVVGYQGPEELLAWVRDVQNGKTRTAALLERAGDRVKNGRVDTRERLDIARELADAGEHARAAEEYVWLWNNMLAHEPSMYGVRLSFMAGDMQLLAEESEEAREAFEGLRDAAEERLRGGDGSWDDLTDWLALNIRVLDDAEPVLAWIERNRDEPEGRATIRRGMQVHEEFLLEHEPVLFGEMVENPVAEFQEDWGLYTSYVPEDHREEYLSHVRTMLGASSARMSAAMLLAGREDEARQLAETAIETLGPEAAGVFAEEADRLGVRRPWHETLRNHAAGS